MSTLSIKHFDTLEYVKQAKKLGTSEELAEFQAKQIEQAIDVAISQIENKELANKGDIRESELRLIAKIEQYRYDSLKFTVWTGIGVVVALGGLLAKGFHWI